MGEPGRLNKAGEALPRGRKGQGRARGGQIKPKSLFLASQLVSQELRKGREGQERSKNAKEILLPSLSLGVLGFLGLFQTAHPFPEYPCTLACQRRTLR